MSESRVEELMDEALRAERSGRFTEARDLLRRAIAADVGPATLEALLRLGRLAIQDGGEDDQAEAERVLAAARSLAEEAGASHSAASAIHLLALLARDRQQHDLAWRLLEESPVGGAAASPSPPRAQWLHYRGLLHAHRGELNTAERCYFQAHQVARECHYKPAQAEVCDSLANLLIRRGKAALALTFARQSLGLKHELGDRYGTAISHGTAGRALLLLARHDEAAEEFERDLALVRELGLSQAEGRLLNDLGMIALLRGRLDEAAAHYATALAFEASPSHYVHALLGLARVHLVARRLDEAVAACDRASALLQAHPGPSGCSAFLRGLRGAIAWRRGDIEAGRGELDAAVAALEAGGHLIDSIPFLYELRDLYQAEGSRAKAVMIMARALDLLSECGSERGVQDVEDWLRTVDTPNLVRLAFERHFPSWLVDDLLAGRLRRPPSRTQAVAVLFSDICGYSSMAEGLGAEAVVQLLNEWFSEVARIVRRHGGFVDKFIGDAVMALFGVPEPRESMAADAVCAAMEMRDALDTINMRRSFLGEPEIRAGIGIDLGDAVVGFIGSHLRQSYTAIGDVVNTAARLETATRETGCDILISEDVEQAQRLCGVAETRFVGRLQLKGIGQAVSAFQVLGPLSPRGAREADGAGEATEV